MAMPEDIKPLLAILFTNNAPARQTLKFEWWLIRRNGQPFLLLPVSGMESHIALELYSAQRLHAKIKRLLLPFFLRSPAAPLLLERVRIEADVDSEFVQFMARQSSVPLDQLKAPAIKVGGAAMHKARFVMLLCDTANRPVKVIKIGLNPRGWVGLQPDGWQATEQEANQLECLPSDLIGCIHMTGRLSTPVITAFATTYFSGDSPRDDEGMEHLFHAWLNPQAPIPLENLNLWRQLETAFCPVDSRMWEALSRAVAGKKVHTTIYHGDFAPWNIRATSQQNLQVFDWERGLSQGIPAWDWFHFFVQTAILARRYHEKRVAAEVENLFQTPRFQIYAAAARIKDIVKPLFLAYLLHQRFIVKPGEGLETTEKLYQFLSVRWGFRSASQLEAPNASRASAKHSQSHLASVYRQLRFAVSQLSNLVWEPTLAQTVNLSMWAQFMAHWETVTVNLSAFAGLLVIQIFWIWHWSLHISLTTFYLIPCLWLTLKLDRRWGALLATVSAILPPLIRHIFDPDALPLEVTLWNIVMRFISFQIVVVLADRIRGQNIFARREKSSSANPIKLSERWAVVAAMVPYFIAVLMIDYYTTPQMNLVPLYLLPCMVLTLTMTWRWGVAAALVTSFAGPYMQRYEADYYKYFDVETWNTVMRLVMFLAVVFILDRIRKENILFTHEKHVELLELTEEFAEANVPSGV